MKHRYEYSKRTLEHIHRVHFNMLYLVENLPQEFKDRFNLDERELLYQVMHHDISKFNDVQFYAYADYFNGSKPNDERQKEIIKNEFMFAWENHKHNENHHFQGQRYMRPNQIIEMVCDWQAMSQEFNEGSCRKYYEEKWRNEFNEYYKNFRVSQGYAGNYSDDAEFFTMDHIIIACIECFELTNELKELNKAK